MERKMGGIAHLAIILYGQDFHPRDPPETCVARRKWRVDSEERRRRKKKRKKEKKKEVEWIGNV